MTDRARGSTHVPAVAGWVTLEQAGLRARTLLVARDDVAFWKHLFESFEDVGIIRTVETRGREVVIALVVPPDFVAEADAIVDDVARRRGRSFESSPLPAVCREDWFLEEWAGLDGDAEAVAGGDEEES